MPNSYVVKVGGRTAGIVVRDNMDEMFSFFATTPVFDTLEGEQHYADDPVARELVAHAKQRRHATSISKPRMQRGRVAT